MLGDEVVLEFFSDALEVVDMLFWLFGVEDITDACGAPDADAVIIATETSDDSAVDVATSDKTLETDGGSTTLTTGAGALITVICGGGTDVVVMTFCLGMGAASVVKGTDGMIIEMTGT